MARQFDDGSTQYLAVDSAVVQSKPFTMACWFNCDDDSTTHTLMWVGHNSYTNYFCNMGIRGTADSNIIRAFQHWYGNGNGMVADTTAGYTENTWHHACAVFAADDDLHVFLDGGNKGEDTTDVGDTSQHTGTAIGYNNDSTPSDPMSGAIAEAAFWNVALTDAEVASLAAGVSPLLVRPAGLIAYWPLIRDTDKDQLGGYHMTPANSPTIATHPPAILSWWHRHARAVAYGAAPPPPAAAPALLAMLGVG